MWQPSKHRMELLYDLWVRVIGVGLVAPVWSREYIVFKAHRR